MKVSQGERALLSTDFLSQDRTLARGWKDGQVSLWLFLKLAIDGDKLTAPGVRRAGLF